MLSKPRKLLCMAVIIGRTCIFAGKARSFNNVYVLCLCKSESKIFTDYLVNRKCQEIVYVLLILSKANELVKGR